MTAPRILALAGSARHGALSVRLRDAAVAALQTAGAQTSVIDLRALALPVYDGDAEAHDGVPEGARALRDAIVAADGVLVVTPEYNGFPTPLLLNAFDWMSRLAADKRGPAGIAATTGKPVAVLSSSPGPLGGLRSMALVRQYLGGTFQMLVLPQQYALSRAHEAFDDAGALKDERARHSVEGIAQGLVRLARQATAPLG